ncbi:MAG TPA: PAS domain S-box protein [Syntrophales bacterium]|nr:PAS domain S-box protein [Syntrophales bacterium]
MTGETQSKEPRKIRFGIRARLMAVLAGLLCVAALIVLYSFQTLDRLRGEMEKMAATDMSSIVLAQQISDQIVVLGDYLLGLKTIENSSKKEQLSSRFKEMTGRLREDLQRMEEMHHEIVCPDPELAGGMRTELEQLSAALRQYEQVLDRRIMTVEELAAQQRRLEEIIARYLAAVDDANRQMRALVSRGLAVNIPEAGKKGRLVQEMDAFLEREMSWLGTAQDLRSNGREMMSLLDAAIAATNPAVVDGLAERADAILLQMSLYKRLPDTPVVRALAAPTADLAGQITAGRRQESVFVLRKRELALKNSLKEAYEKISSQAYHLREDATKMNVAHSRVTRGAIINANKEVQQAKQILMGISLLAGMILLFALYYLVHVRIIRRVEKLTQVMNQAAGDASRGEQQALAEPMRALLGSGRDEIAAMGEAFAVFVDAILQEQYFSDTTINSLPGIFYMYDDTGRLIRWNKNGETIFGYASKEIKGEDALKFIVPADRQRVRTAIKKVFTDGYAEVAATMLANSGQEIPFYLTGARMFKGDKVYGIGTGIDMTELRTSTEALRRSEEKYRNIFENSLEGIFQSSLEGRLLTVNPTMARMYGYASPEEMMAEIADIGRQMYANAAQREELLQNLNTDGTVVAYEIQQRRKDGSVFWVSENARAVRDEQGAIRYYEGLLEDISQRKEAEAKLQQSLQRLRNAIGATIQVMVSAVETRDPYTAGHQMRTADLARAIAGEMGLPQEKIDGIRMAGAIHDIGKLSIPAEILSKPTKLTAIERCLIKEHTRIGYQILKEIESPWPLAQIIYQHHERLDGSGYPEGVRGEEILLETRILSVADVVESMASHRPYRPALGLAQALAEIESQQGIAYDAEVVAACLRLFQEKGYQFPQPRHEQ